MLGCVCRLSAGSFLQDEARGSTRSASLPWRSAASKTPATWPARSGSTWRTRWSRAHACWWTLGERGGGKRSSINDKSNYIYRNRYSFESHCHEWLVAFTVGIPHLLLSPLHVSKVIDNGLWEVLQSPQLHLQRLQLLHLGNLKRQRPTIGTGCPWSSVALNVVQQVSLLDNTKKAELVCWNALTWWGTAQLQLHLHPLQVMFNQKPRNKMTEF